MTDCVTKGYRKFCEAAVPGGIAGDGQAGDWDGRWGAMIAQGLARAKPGIIASLEIAELPLCCAKCKMLDGAPGNGDRWMETVFKCFIAGKHRGGRSLEHVPIHKKRAKWCPLKEV